MRMTFNLGHLFLHVVQQWCAPLLIHANDKWSSVLHLSVLLSGASVTIAVLASTSLLDVLLSAATETRQNAPHE